MNKLWKICQSNSFIASNISNHQALAQVHTFVQFILIQNQPTWTRKRLAAPRMKAPHPMADLTSELGGIRCGSWGSTFSPLMVNTLNTRLSLINLWGPTTRSSSPSENKDKLLRDAFKKN